MSTVAQAFETFLQSLELTEGQTDEASRQHTYLRTELQQRMEVEDNFLSGSYARRTAIRPLNDIDVFLVLRETTRYSRSSTPQAVLEQVRAALAAAYPQKTPRVQARSVNIEFVGTGIAYDVVPAFSERDGVYVIPDRDQSRWIRTNPRRHAELATAANERSNKRIKPLIKAVKHASRVHGADTRSFHLEVLSWGASAAVASGSYLAGLVELLRHLRSSVTGPCPDPSELGPDIRPSSERCAAAQTWLAQMHALAHEAEALAQDGRTGEAHAKLRELFGDEWPEKGSKPRGGGAAIVSSGVDGRGSSFG